MFRRNDKKKSTFPQPRSSSVPPPPKPEYFF